MIEKLYSFRTEIAQNFSIVLYLSLDFLFSFSFVGIH